MKINISEIKNVNTMQTKIMELKRVGCSDSDIINILMGNKKEVTEQDLRYDLKSKVSQFIDREFNKISLDNLNSILDNSADSIYNVTRLPEFSFDSFCEDQGIQNNNENFNNEEIQGDFEDWRHDQEMNFYPTGDCYEIKNRSTFDWMEKSLEKIGFGIIEETDNLNHVIYVPSQSQFMSHYWAPLYLDLFGEKEQYKEVKLDQLS